METTSRLAKYDIIIGIDKSGSMGDPGKNMPTKWEEAREATKALVREAVKFDSDGITVSLFSGGSVHTTDNVNDAAIVDKIFTENSPMGNTPTDLFLKKHLDAYFAAKSAGSNPKPILIACITDGAPNNQSAVQSVIVDATKKMDADEEVGITFLQVGDDAGATAFLKHLDDELKPAGAKFDIVNTEVLNDVENIVTCLENALDD